MRPESARGKRCARGLPRCSKEELCFSLLRTSMGSLSSPKTRRREGSGVSSNGIRSHQSAESPGSKFDRHRQAVEQWASWGVDPFYTKDSRLSQPTAENGETLNIDEDPRKRAASIQGSIPFETVDFIVTTPVRDLILSLVHCSANSALQFSARLLTHKELSPPCS